MAQAAKTSLELSDGHVEAIEAVLGPISPEVMTGLAQAALTEYALAFSGERVPAGVRDLRELRLRLLAEYLPGGLPSERQVGALFHLTSAQARNLISGTRARYPRELTDALAAAAKAALTSADAVGKSTIRLTASPSLAAFIRDLLQDSTTPPPVRRPDSALRYDVDRETAVELSKQLGLQVDQLPKSK